MSILTVNPNSYSTVHSMLTQSLPKLSFSKRLELLGSFLGQFLPTTSLWVSREYKELEFLWMQPNSISL